MKWRLLHWPNDRGLDGDTLRSKVAKITEGKGLFLLVKEDLNGRMTAKNVELLLTDEEADSLEKQLKK